MASHELLLAPATRLIHIGPPKTGTTGVQTAFHDARGSLQQFGVVYGGRGIQPLRAAAWVVQATGMRGERAPGPEDWAKLVQEVQSAGDRRVVVSSEFFSEADNAQARRIVDDLAGGPRHVVVTLRPLYKIIPSQWQQYVQNGLRMPYSEWLEAMFRRTPDESLTPSFWRRHRHGDVVRHWADAAGAENLTVVVVDESDPGMLMRTFEAFVGLPEGFLVPPQDAANRSLTLGETELVRLLNVEFGRRGWSAEAHARLVRKGAVRWIKTGRRPAPDEPRLGMPRWALYQAAELGVETAKAISSLGVRVVGDLTALGAVPEVKATQDEPDAAPMLPADAAAHAMLAAILGEKRDLVGSETLPVGVAARGVVNAMAATGLVDPPESSVELRPVADITNRERRRTVLTRGRRSLKRRLGRLRRRLRRR